MFYTFSGIKGAVLGLFMSLQTETLQDEVLIFDEIIVCDNQWRRDAQLSITDLDCFDR